MGVDQLVSGGDVNDPTYDSVTTDELRGDWDTLVSTGAGLVDALANSSPGEIIQIASKSITTSQWMDLDVDDEVVRGVDGQTTISVANGANVGGFRLGHSTAVSGVTIKDIEFDGNADNQDQSIERLHAFIAEDATDYEFENCTATRTSPHHEVLTNPEDAHNSGGSGFTARSAATDGVYRDCDTYDIGDRAFQLAGSGHELIRPKTRDGFDRSVSLDVQLPDDTWDGADNVTIRGGDFKDNSAGSFIATREYGATDVTISDCKMQGTFRGAIQQDNSNCADWSIQSLDVKHTGADGSQAGLILEDGTVVSGGRLVEDSATGWAPPVVIRGRVEVDGLTVDIRNSDKSSQVVGVSASEPMDWRGGKIVCGPHGSGFNLNSAGPDSTIVGVTIDEFGDGGGVGAAVRVNTSNVKVSDLTGLTANTPRAFIAWDNDSGVCTDNYDRSGASTHYDFALSPDLTADNYPAPP